MEQKKNSNSQHQARDNPHPIPNNAHNPLVVTLVIPSLSTATQGRRRWSHRHA